MTTRAIPGRGEVASERIPAECNECITGCTQALKGAKGVKG
jgi:hypothetical protein